MKLSRHIIDLGKRSLGGEQRKGNGFIVKKVISIEEAIAESQQLREQHHTIVLVGGCFDILHVGHIIFLEQAKARGDRLFVLLESDESIRNTKGDGRPVNTQHNRALVLAALTAVDAVVLLPKPMDNAGYDALVLQLKPAIIATTNGDPYRHHKERQASLIGGEVVDVTDRLPEHSTSTVVTKLEDI